MGKSRTQKSLINVIFGLGGQGIELILKIVGRTIFIYFLDKKYLGANSLFGEVLTVLSLAELGVGTALNYALYKPLREDNKPRIAALMDLYRKAYYYIGFGVAVLGALLIPFLGVIIKDPGPLKGQVIPIYLFYLFNTSITYFYSYKSSILVADQKNYIVQTVKEISNITRTVLQIGVLLLWQNFYLYLAVESVCIFANNYIISRVADRKYTYMRILRGQEKLDKKSIKDIFKNVKALSITKVSTIMVNSTDNIIITGICGLDITALYANYVMFTTIINTLLSQMFSNLYPSIGNLNAEGDKKHSRFVFNGMTLMCFWAFSVASIGLFVMLNDAIYVWIGESWLLPTAVVVIVAVNTFMRGFHNAIWLFKDSFGLFVYGQYMSFVTALLNIGLSFGFGYLFRSQFTSVSKSFGLEMGLFGVLLATAVSRLVTNIWYDPWMLFKHGFNLSVVPFYFEYLGYICIMVATGAATYFVAGLINVTGWISLFEKFAVTLILPNIIYLVVFFKTKRFNYITERLLSVFRKRAG